MLDRGTALVIALLLGASCGPGYKASDYLHDSTASAGAGAGIARGVNPPATPAQTNSQPDDFFNAGPPSGRGPDTTPPHPWFLPGTSSEPSANVSGTLASPLLTDAGDGWLTLIDADWTLAANSEGYLCARVTAPRDLFLHAFQPITPTGTHHTVLSAASNTGVPDGVMPCRTDTSGHNIYGAGVGSTEETLPDGLAMHISPGEQLDLNLHLFNANDTELHGRSGVRVRTLERADVKQVADRILAGPIGFSFPPGHATAGGQCTWSADSTLLSVGPHMHKLGVHMKVTAERVQGGSSVLFDGPYSFDSQARYPVDGVSLAAGDRIVVGCDYENDTGHTVSFGTSTLDEMCFASITYYPAFGSGNYLCSN